MVSASIDFVLRRPEQRPGSGRGAERPASRTSTVSAGDVGAYNPLMRFMTSCVLMLLLAGATAWTAGEGGWDPKAAASYLDGRANWRSGVRGVGRGTELCVS